MAPAWRGIGTSAGSALTRAWLRAGRAVTDRRAGRPQLLPNRHALIEQLAPGSSFLDLGGMFGVAGDVAFRAERAGASRVVLFDGMDPSPEFEAEHRASGSAVEYVQGDLHDPDDIEALGRFDVVWCAGVIYHSPNPYQQLLHLRRLCGRRLLLGTHVIPEVPGVENACLFYPGRSPAAQAAFAEAHGARAGDFPGATGPFIDAPNLGYANMWWGMTPSAVKSMLRYSGFELQEEFEYTWFFRDYLCGLGPEPAFIPSAGFSRRRGEERLAGYGGELPGWAPHRL